jgi:hypothetical protein
MVLIYRKHSHQIRDISNKTLTIDDNQESLRLLITGGENKTTEFKSTVWKI